MTSSDHPPIVVIACRIFQVLLEHYLPDMMASQVTFLDYGLHRTPPKIAKAVQAEIDKLERPSLVVVGYGLCGNGIVGIKAGMHTLLVPRMDDCIAMMLGSYDAYRREFETSPATFYLNRGWLESGSHPLHEHEEYLERFDEETADWLLDQQYHHYKRIALVAHNPADMNGYRAQAQAVAKFCERWNVRYAEVLGSDDFARRLAAATRDLSLVDGDLVVIPPGGEIQQAQFLRSLE